MTADGSYIVPLGKFKGHPIRDCDIKYLEWLVDWEELYEDTRTAVQTEIDRRNGGSSVVPIEPEDHASIRVDEPKEVLPAGTEDRATRLMLQLVDEGYAGMLMRGHNKLHMTEVAERVRRLIRGETVVDDVPF